MKDEIRMTARKWIAGVLCAAMLLGQFGISTHAQQTTGGETLEESYTEETTAPETTVP